MALMIDRPRTSRFMKYLFLRNLITRLFGIFNYVDNMICHPQVGNRLLGINLIHSPPKTFIKSFICQAGGEEISPNKEENKKNFISFCL